MTNIIKQGSSLIIQGDVNSYPFKDGKISLPLNSLYFVIDESNVISFKQTRDNNTLLSVNINNLQINGEEVTKENLIEKFDAVANGSMGGTKINAGTNITLQPQEDGSITISATGELGGTVAWADVTDKPSTFTPSAHTHLSADITDLQGKLDAKQNTLVSGTNIKTINGESILGEGNITIEGGTGDVTQQYVDEQLALKVDKTAYEADKATFALKTEIPSIEGLASKEELKNGLDGKQDKGDYALKSELPDISGLATKAELTAKQDTLVSGTNIKTVNGQTLLGEGNIEIQGGGSGISDAPSDNKLYGRKNANWSEIIIPSTDNFATKSEIADMLTKTEASEKYQPKGEYLTEVPSEYVTETELSSKGYLTAIPEVYVTNEELTSALSSKQDKGDYATKAELNLKANTSDLSNYLQTSVAESTYAKKSEIPEEYTLPIATAEVLGGIKVGAGLSINPGTGVLSATGGGTADSVDWANITSKPDDIVNITDKLAEKLDVSTYNSEKATFATKQEVTEGLEAKQDTLVSGTNIKTVNGTSLLGSGDITIEAGTSGVTREYVDEQLALKADKTSVPTVQENATGDTNNYIYSKFNDTTNIVVNSGDSPSNYDTLNKNVLSFVHIIRNKTEFKIRFNSWNSKSLSFNSSGDWMATNSKAGFITGGDKQKLDSINVSNLATKDELSAKQDTLISGTNIKTVNGNSLLGEGDIVIEGGSTGNDVQEVSGITNVSVGSVKENRIYIDANTIEDVPSTYAREVAAPIAYGNIYLGNNGKLLKVYDKDTLTKTEASTTYALQSALQAALERIAALEAQVGNISSQLDVINGEIIE